MDARAYHEFLQRSHTELQAQLASLNAAFARALHDLRGRITMAAELLEGDGMEEEQVRALLKQAIEAHPQGRAAADLLQRIEGLEARLRDVETRLASARG